MLGVKIKRCLKNSRKVEILQYTNEVYLLGISLLWSNQICYFSSQSFITIPFCNLTVLSPTVAPEDSHRGGSLVLSNYYLGSCEKEWLGYQKPARPCLHRRGWSSWRNLEKSSPTGPWNQKVWNRGQVLDSLIGCLIQCLVVSVHCSVSFTSFLPAILLYVCVSLLKIFPLFAPFHTAFHSPCRLTLCRVSYQPDTQSVFKPKMTLPLSRKLLLPLHILSPWLAGSLLPLCAALSFPWMFG